MQNNEHSESNRFRKFFQEKGYYIVLLLCILAVGISGYIFVSGAVSEKKSLNEQTLSVAVFLRRQNTVGWEHTDAEARKRFFRSCGRRGRIRAGAGKRDAFGSRLAGLGRTHRRVQYAGAVL